MKLKNAYIFLLILCLLCCESVFAEKIIRGYGDEEEYGAMYVPRFLIQYDTDDKTYTLAAKANNDHKCGEEGADANCYEYNGTYYILGGESYEPILVGSHYFYNYLNELETPQEITSNQALDIFYCTAVEEAGTPNFPKTNYHIAIFIDESQYVEYIQADDPNLKNKTFTCEALSSYEVKDEEVEGVRGCPSYNEKITSLDEYYSTYVDNNYTDLSSLKKIKELESQLRAICRSVTQEVDFNSFCMEYCLNLREDIDEIKEKYNINTYSGSSCGFSDRILNFVGNIMKWVKYIMPVLVILFGILDFIKAISGDKDEEMKKAQGRFVKRLISAALVFIIPFIIEFVLDKMGFVTNGCGIIDL